MGRISWDSWSLVCPGSSNMLFQWRMSSFKNKNQWHPWVKIRVIASSSCNSLLSLMNVAKRTLYFFTTPTKTTLFGQGYGSLLVAVLALLSWQHYPWYFFVLHNVLTFIVSGFYLSSLSMLARNFGFGPRHPAPGVSSNVRGLFRKPSNLTMALSQHDLLLWSKTLYLDRRHMSDFFLCVLDLVALSSCAGTGCLRPVGWLNMC